ncbi:cyclic peptide export ABC transporter [Chitinophaga varians]|uniref:cyclic peptide export ABC transporter n=1 Tax=Chitinophaga varians TaxID=2202339 RepID=UPI00165FDC5D|nr:cyclic peptide export ABC transporter [Chitinophaga varians]MBC9912782.1 cyclic peptide export ABC transporter [Chitinophaga varians]
MNFSKKDWKKYIYFTFLSIMAALGNMGVVYTINRIIGDYFTAAAVLPRTYLMLFAGSLVLFIVCRWMVALGIIKFTQQLLYTTRITVLKMVLGSPFTVLVKNRNRVFAALTNDTNNIVNASVSVVDVLTNTIVILICFAYMGTLSWKLLLCMLGLMLFTLGIYYLCVKRAGHFFRLALAKNDVFIKYLNEILAGFKEISIAPVKGAEISGKHIHKAIGDGALLNQKAQISFLNNRIIGQVAFYVFIGLIMLGLGGVFAVERAVVVKFVFLILYIWSPIETVILLVPNLLQAKASIGRVNELERLITGKETVIAEALPIAPFEGLQLGNIGFRYLSETDGAAAIPFRIGPIDLQIKAGEVIFISGGNGSGKTTFINILVGLIAQDEGVIKANGHAVLPAHMESYRSLFAPVFSDFHLFDEFYGMPDLDVEKAARYLELFEIDHKVTIEEGKLLNINISTGQRKRLALIYAMLEKKPILVLDEFAADQDPHFKKKFYKEILGVMKQEGFTVIAITHDDHYYQYADRLYKMDAGLLSEVKAIGHDLLLN